MEGLRGGIGWVVGGGVLVFVFDGMAIGAGWVDV